MRIRNGIITAAIGAAAALAGTQEFRPDIPKVWDDKEVSNFETPLAQRDRSPRYMTSQEYYALKVRPIYRSYPVYVEGHQPPGYIESLKQKEPEVIFDSAKLHTKEDWIAAGKIVFEAETRYLPAPDAAPPASNFFLPAPANGIPAPFMPFARYYVRKKGVLEIGINACVGCHTRVMPDGSLIEGAQGIVDQPPTEPQLQRIRERTPDALGRAVERDWILFGAPWIMSKEDFAKSRTNDEVVNELAASHPGVFPRQGTSPSHPPHIPSLIGIQDLKFLDATGLVRQRSIADLMRYAVINQGLDTLAHFGDFQPSPKAAAFSGDEGTRYSDEQLYAMALYLYSLKPPANPNPFDDRARRGQQIFQQQGCSGCHVPPLYTNNKLTPVVGFQVPDDMKESGEVLNRSVGTDPTLALKTRRGTGFYKVPSLRGVWYRNAFGHAGQAETLEEWLNPARLRDDYVPKGYHLGPGPIKGHEFGLKLPPQDRQALIAFLKTL